uniref:C-type lectin domain-containing protein n=1 Tax=Macrostomum lignano TaxID=282301 RepID=A0A1I8F6Z6_9PLAT
TPRSRHPPLERLLLCRETDQERPQPAEPAPTARLASPSLYDVPWRRLLARFSVGRCFTNSSTGDKLARRPYQRDARSMAALGLGARAAGRTCSTKRTARLLLHSLGKKRGRKAAKAASVGAAARSSKGVGSAVETSTRRLLAGLFSFARHASRFAAPGWSTIFTGGCDVTVGLKCLGQAVPCPCCLSMNWIMSLTHSETGFRAMLASARSCLNNLLLLAMDDIFRPNCREGLVVALLSVAMATVQEARHQRVLPQQPQVCTEFIGSQGWRDDSFCFTSPFYPAQYPNNTDCIKRSSECLNDYLEIRMARSAIAPPLRACRMATTAGCAASGRRPDTGAPHLTGCSARQGRFLWLRFPLRRGHQAPGPAAGVPQCGGVRRQFGKPAPSRQTDLLAQATPRTAPRNQ